MGCCFIQLKDKPLRDQVIFVRLPPSAERVPQGGVGYTLL